MMPTPAAEMTDRIAVCGDHPPKDGLPLAAVKGSRPGVWLLKEVPPRLAYLDVADVGPPL
jgi:hypothetical protein